MKHIQLTAITVSLIVCLALGARAEIFFQEVITDSSTYRVTRVPGEPGVVAFEETTAGNSAFGVPAKSLSYVHSVVGISPPLLPDGRIHVARLKLYFRSHSGDDIAVTVDSVALDNVTRRNFLIGPSRHDSVSVLDSPLSDGILEIVISNPDQDFVFYCSVFDVRYDSGLPTAVESAEGAIPSAFALAPNYPNPFNLATTIEYALAGPGHVRLELVDILGRPVRILVDEAQLSGRHVLAWDGTDDTGMPVSSGVYFSVLKMGSSIASRKMVLLK